VFSQSLRKTAFLLFSFLLFVPQTQAAEGDAALLDVLLENGSITPEQYETLGGDGAPGAAAADAEDADPLPPVAAAGSDDDEEDEDQQLNERIATAVAKKIEEEFPVLASYGKKGFRLETRDGNWQTNLQWRFQFRLTWPTSGDPRQVDNFAANEEVTFETRRLRMKIGGHGYRPWLKYYFEVDLQPTRDADDSSSTASARVIDWRVDVAKWKQFGVRVGQWKIDYNRERVDSSGRQEFVERSIVNRIFTIDRQIGVSFRGRLFEGTHADMRYYAGVFTGEGRGVRNDDNNMMYVARLQWNFLGRDLGHRQTDVERTERPTGSLAFAASTTKGKCTRWSSSGCGNLDGFTNANLATQSQFRVHQAVEELAFKWQGFAFQQEFHWKRVIDRSFLTSNGLHDTDFYGLYAQAGYFFNEILDFVPEELELAFRYGLVREANETNRLKTNSRNEYTVAANWFFWGHNNKITADYSYLTLDDDVLARNVSDHRARLQWDISF
jgi:phosphate-selective porin OprO and OprP